MSHQAARRNESLRALRPRVPPFLFVLFFLCVSVCADASPQNTNPGYRGLSYTERGTVNVREPGEVQVNTHNGNLVVQRTLFLIPGRGLPVQFQLTYNSDHRLISSPFGFGWNLSYNIRYTRDSSGNVVIVWGDGRLDGYTQTGGTFNSPAGVYMTLTEPVAGQLVLTTKHGISFNFADSSHQKVTSISDPNGNNLVFTYGAGRLTTVTDAGSRSYILSYAFDGKLIQLFDNAAIRSYTFAYDATGRLTGITERLGNTEAFTYDSENLLTGITDRRGNAATITYITPAGDPNTRLPQTITKAGSTTGFAYDSAILTTTLTDPNGNNWTYAYDPSRVVSVGDPTGNSTDFTWDSNDNLLTLTDRNGNTTTFTYDALGNILSQLDALGNTSTFTYEPNFNRLLTLTDRTGNTSSNTYDAGGNRTGSTDPLGNFIARTYDAAGQMTARTDRRNNTTRFAYDANGNPSSVTDPLNNLTQFTYAAGSRLTKMTNAVGNVTSFAYDALDRLTTTTDALVNSDARAYDANGNLTTYTDFRGNDWTRSFDALNREIGRTNPTGGVWAYAYDPAGNRIRHTDAEFQVTTNTYDSLNRLTGQTFADATTAAYIYDAVGNLLTAADASSDYDYTYDALNRRTQFTDNGFAKSVLYAYDAQGRRVSKTGPEGDVATSAYDAAGRLVTFTDPTGNSTMTYDAAGNRLTDVRPNGVTTTATYAANNRLLSTSHANAGGVLQSFAYTRDAAGRVTQATRETGEVIAYTHESLGRVTQETGGLGPDAYTRAQEFDANGNRTRLLDIRSFGTSDQSFTYDTANRDSNPQFAHDANGARTSVFGNVFTYDAHNRLATPPDGTTYTYDVFNRLIAINSPFSGLKRIMYGSNTPALIDDNGQVKTCMEEIGRLRLKISALREDATFLSGQRSDLGAYYDDGVLHGILYNAAVQSELQFGPLGRVFVELVRDDLLDPVDTVQARRSFLETELLRKLRSCVSATANTQIHTGDNRGADVRHSAATDSTGALTDTGTTHADRATRFTDRQFGPNSEVVSFEPGQTPDEGNSFVIEIDGVVLDFSKYVLNPGVTEGNRGDWPAWVQKETGGHEGGRIIPVRGDPN